MKNLIVGTFGLLLICSGQGLWQASAADEAKNDSEGGWTELRIIEEKGPGGHSTIDIDESTVSHEGVRELPLTFSELMAWDYS